MMKKVVQVLGVVLLLGLLLAACGHKHTFAAWVSDAESHWRVCECGETAEKEAHTTSSTWGYCSVCGLSVNSFDDGTYSVIGYDEHGAISSQIDYDADGTVRSEMNRERKYDENGNVTYEKVYQDGVLQSEYFYQLSTKSSVSTVYVSEEITYYGDYKYISKYDENWNLLSYTTCDLKGTVVMEERYEYEFDADGNAVRTTCYVDDEISDVSEDMVGPNGTMYNVSTIYYENGKLQYTIKNEYEFDDAGEMICKQEYTNGVLSYEVRYKQSNSTDYYMCYEAKYDNNTLLWAYNYDAAGNIVK